MNLSEQIMRNLNNKERLCEQASIGYTEDNYGVFVSRDNGEDTPHFFYTAEDCTLFFSNICITKPEYYCYDGGLQYLNSKQKEKLIRFLQEPDDIEPRKTRWQVLLIEWNRNNPNCKVDINLKMPDYMKL